MTAQAYRIACNQLWVDEGGIDGFNLAYAVTPGTVTEFIDHVVHELQRRDRLQIDYTPGDFRQYLIGTHPAAAFHGAYAGRESVADTAAEWDFARAQASVAAE